jgi:hypothetical protein
MALLEYQDKWDEFIITKETVEKITGLSFFSWCFTTGILVNSYTIKLAKLEDFNISGVYPKLEIWLSNKNIPSLYIEYDLKKKVIKAGEIFLSKKLRNKKIGREIFGMHIKIVSALGFKHILCWAYGGKEDKEGLYNGYITWAIFGFTMMPSSRNQFLELVEGRNEKSLNHLILSTEGLEFWTANGFPWWGIFRLNKGSLNWWLWLKYLDKK